MGRPQGLPKTGGRQKGSLNKKTTDLQEQLEGLSFNVAEKVIEILPQLPATKQADVLMELMSFLYPKRRPVDSFEPESENEENNNIPKRSEKEFLEQLVLYGENAKVMLEMDDFLATKDKTENDTKPC